MTDSEELGPEDRRLAEAMGAFEPGDAQARRMRLGVLEAYEADHTSLLAEWVGMLRLRPAAHGGWLVAAAAALLAQLAPYLPIW